MSDLRDFIQRCDHTSIGLYLVEYDRMAEQLEELRQSLALIEDFAGKNEGHHTGFVHIGRIARLALRPFDRASNPASEPEGE